MNDEALVHLSLSRRICGLNDGQNINFIESWLILYFYPIARPKCTMWTQ